MPKRKPDLIQCPNCNALRVNRRNGKCSICGTPLVYLSEFSFQEEVMNGFIFLPDRNMWVRISDYLEEQRREGRVKS